jgi:hypothetical protein
LAGLRAAVFLAVDFRAVRLLAGGTVTTFLFGIVECCSIEPAVAGSTTC